MATKVIVCPPPPPPPSPQLQSNSSAPAATVGQTTAQLNSANAANLQGFASQPWQGWFSQVYNQIKTQFVTTTAVADTAATNASTALSDAAAAIAAVGAKLNRSAADILSGAIDVQTAGGFKAGTMTWDAAGNRTGGYGVAFTTKGIVGYSSSLAGVSFAINATTGDASFAGNLSAANGTFTGTLVSVNGTFVGSLVAATMTGGTITGTIIQTGSGFPRTEMNSTGIRAYDSGGNTILTADYSGVSCNKPAGSIAAAVTATSASNVAASLQSTCTGSADAAILTANSGSAVSVQSTSGNAITILGGGNGISQAGGGACFLSTVAPRIDNSFSLGTSGSLRWTAVYAMSAVITTSDVRTKNRIETVSIGLDFVKALRPIQYYMNVSENKVVETYTEPGKAPDIELIPVAGTRLHYGFPAQEVKAALGVCGVPDAALWTLANPEDADSIQSLRYEEFIPVLWRAVQELTAKVEALEASLAAKGGV